MGISVQEALEIGGLKGAKVIAGASGLNREIEYVTVFEVPDIIQWLKGKELVLTSGFALPKNEDEQKDLINQLASKGIAALAIKAERFLKTIPQAMLDAANSNNLPLIKFEPGVTYKDIIRPIMAEIITKENERTLEHSIINDLERSLRDNFVEDLLLNHIKSETVAKRRIGLLGLSVSSNYTMAIIQLIKKVVTDELSRILKPLEKGLLKEGYSIIATIANNRIVLLIDLEGNDDFYLRDFFVHLKGVFSTVFKKPVCIGIGESFSNLLEARKSYLQAEEAVEFGLKYWGENSCTFFSDIGVYRLIHKFALQDNVWDYIPKGLRNLLDYDREQGTELVKTLKCYLKNAGNSQKTANELYVHYKTLQYRLKRISEITGMDLDSGEARLILFLSLKILEVNEKRK
ncbi:MAG: PucR family transcriptional regulator, purine catabolism regulatory protein [Clostridia bacterium]|jgi:sugar diacid utilization regulator|nr:PucR family transcriptional regulator, purine catabolism regulatory protein [Clostridia bacterium]MDN5322441.1 PucR family transcriptional regulator, purine catabolism regulatory protein [Clostridia bacterium]